MSKRRFWVLTLFTVGAAIGAASTRALDPPQAHDAAGAAVVEVKISEFTFQADTIRVTPGTVVRWINRDQVAHTSTAEDGEWKSPLLGPGETFERRYDKEGEYPYFCTPHPFMRGVVIVEADTASA